jgi:transposase
VSIRQRVYPDLDAAQWFERHCADSRAVKNAALEQARQYDQRRGPTPGPAARQKQLTEARQALPWQAEGSSSVQQHALREFDQAMRNFFGGTHAFPTWFKRGINEGFVIRDLRLRRLNRKWGAMQVPKAGWVRFRATRPWTEIEAASSARVTRDRSRRWHVSFVCAPPAFKRQRTGALSGVDRGARNSIATSDGRLDFAPSLSSGEQARFLKLQRQLARQEKRSGRRERTRRQLARLHAKLGDRRKDWVEKTTTRLIQENDWTFLEDLNTNGMLRRPAPKPDPDQDGRWLPNRARAKAKLNRAILASQWGRLEQRARDKTVGMKHTPTSTRRTTSATVESRPSSGQRYAAGHAVNAHARPRATGAV